MHPKRVRRKFVVFTLFLLGMGAVILFTPLGKELTPERLHTLGERLAVSPLLPILYPLLLAIAVWAMLPAFPFVIAAGLLFGPLAGAALSWPGVTLGAILSFASGRSFLHGFVQKHIGRSPRLTRLDDMTRHNGLLFALMARLILIIPWNVFNYAASLTSIRFRDYAVGTVIGILPEILVMSLLGSALADWKRHPEGIILPLLLNIVIFSLAVLVKRKMKKPEN